MAEVVATHKAEGYTRFQLKVGADPAEDIKRIRSAAAILGLEDRLVADANTGWLMHDARRAVQGVSDLDVYIEQPCLSYAECLAIRRHTRLPFVLDESIDGLQTLLPDHGGHAMDVVNL